MDIGIEIGQPVHADSTGQSVDVPSTQRSEGGVGRRGRGLLWVLLRVRLLVGFYCDIMPCAPLRLLARLYCFAVAYSLIVMVILFLTNYDMHVLTFMPLLTEYVAYVIISTVTEEKHLFEFLKEIEIFDMEIGSDLPLVTNGLKYLFLGCCIWAITLVISYSLLIEHRLINSFCLLIAVVSFANHISHCTLFLPMDLMRIRIKYLRRIFQSKLEQESCSHRAQIEVINDTLRIYKTLIDGFKNAFSWQKILICISLVCSFTDFVIIGSERFSDTFKEDMPLFRTILFLLDIIDITLFASLPSVLGELISSEVDKLKLVIGNQLLICDDAAVGDALSHAAEYLRQRSARVTLGRACALDAALVLAFLSRCTTYWIVMLQFIGTM